MSAIGATGTRYAHTELFFSLPEAIVLERSTMPCTPLTCRELSDLFHNAIGPGAHDCFRRMAPSISVITRVGLSGIATARQATKPSGRISVAPVEDRP